MTSAISEFSASLAATSMSAAEVLEASHSKAERLKMGQDFEAMFLRQTLESILPDSKNSVFGGGTAGGMWRSMMADKISGVLAERGVLGLSDMLAKTKEVK